MDNRKAISMVVSAAHKATSENPFLSFPTQVDGWVIRNSILNEISAVNPVGSHNFKTVRYNNRSLGFFLANTPNTVHKWYAFGLTCEKDPELFQRKLRVLIASEDDLKVIGYPDLPISITNFFYNRRAW